MTSDDQSDLERKRGYEDARQELESMLSCPVCHAIRYLDNTEPSPGYQGGWRLAMMGVKHDWRHECSKGERA